MLKVFRISMCILLVMWMAVIFTFSSQNATESSVTSGRVAKVIAQILIKNYDKMSDAEQHQTISSLQFITRKSAHFSVYAVLGILSFLTIISYKYLSLKIKITVSGLICLLYSISDEVHQLFINGRSGQITDVMIDFSGSLVAIMLCFLLYKLYLRKKQRYRDGDRI